MNNIENKINHNLEGIKKVIGIFYGDTNVNYQINLFIKSKKLYMKKFKSYIKKFNNIEESKFEALQDIYNDLYKISNIR